jgi:hypothetical protein
MRVALMIRPAGIDYNLEQRPVDATTALLQERSNCQLGKSDAEPNRSARTAA